MYNKTTQTSSEGTPGELVPLESFQWDDEFGHHAFAGAGDATTPTGEEVFDDLEGSLPPGLARLPHIGLIAPAEVHSPCLLSSVLYCA